MEANNFTVDPELISTLPPSDPLFVAETVPALATLENPDLLRRFGLILVNADGFDSAERVRAPRRAKRAGARKLDDAPGPELLHRFQHERAKSQSTRAPGLGQ